MSYGRRDENEPELVTLARQLGAHWQMIGPLDGWILHRGLWLPVEIKRPAREGLKSEYTPAQQRFITFCRNNGGRWVVWRTRADVMRTLGARVSA